MSINPNSRIELAERVERIMSAADADGFSGVVRVDVDGALVHESAHGLADRAHRVDNTVDTRFAAASGAKGFTALVVLSLIEQGVISLATPARALLGRDLPLVDPTVTIEHLLSHRSGIGDYLDEDTVTSITDYVMDIPVHELASLEQHLRVLDGRPMSTPPGDCFKYNNSGFVLLALLAERASRDSFYDLVDTIICRPAGLTGTAFLRSDELPGDTAIGYLHADGLRTNTLHMPVRGGGDGGIYTNANDMSQFWRALLDGRIVKPATVELIATPHGTTPCGTPYGLGFWLDPTSDIISLEGYDAGVSFRSDHQPSRNLTWTVLANSSDGAWPVADQLTQLLATSRQ